MKATHLMKRLLLLLIFLPLFSQAQDWPIRGTKDWDAWYAKNINDTCQVIPLGVDFGLCAMPLGWGLTDSGCVVLSGCGWIGSDGIDYTSSFFASSYQCNGACLQDTVVMLACIDSALIDLQVLCPGIYEPVCGCDSVTYENACVATNHAGVSSFYPGACVTSKVSKQLNLPFLLYPNPSMGQITIEKLPANATIEVLNLMGQKLETHHCNATSIELDLAHLARGTYLLQLNNTHCVTFLIE
jgi:hypothetical protein